MLVDDSGGMVDAPATAINDGLRSLIAEMEIISKGTKPYFKITIVAIGSRSEIITEATPERDVDIERIAQFRGSRGSANVSDAFDKAYDVLKRHPGRATDFRPYVFLMSGSRPDDESKAIRSALRVKGISIPAGAPIVICLGYGDADEVFLSTVASNGKFFVRSPDSTSLARFIPNIGTLAGSKAEEETLTAAILRLI
jgi:uncharacterized protein YegL